MKGEKGMRCTMCDKELDMWDEQEDFSLQRWIGYGSAYDLQYLDMRFCCECFDRKTLVQRQKNKLKKLKRIICRKYKENGEKLFDYLYETALYWVSKAYVIANLYNIIDEEIEEW